MKFHLDILLLPLIEQLLYTILLFDKIFNILSNIIIVYNITCCDIHMNN